MQLSRFYQLTPVASAALGPSRVCRSLAGLPSRPVAPSFFPFIRHLSGDVRCKPARPLTLRPGGGDTHTRAARSGTQAAEATRRRPRTNNAGCNQTVRGRRWCVRASARATAVSDCTELLKLAIRWELAAGDGLPRRQDVPERQVRGRLIHYFYWLQCTTSVLIRLPSNVVYRQLHGNLKMKRGYSCSLKFALRNVR